jgi:hypothetical protein
MAKVVKVVKVVQTLEHYWKLREQCSKGKHKFRDNNFGVTWCVVCGQHSTSPSNIPLKPEECIIISDLK